MATAYDYEIRIEGDLGEQWAEWFGGLAIQPGPEGETVLRGRIADQAALMGMLSKIHSLNLRLISVVRTHGPIDQTAGTLSSNGSVRQSESVD